MRQSKAQNAKRKIVWDATKAAVGAYARNPCEATAVEVEAALERVRRLPSAAVANPGPARAVKAPDEPGSRPRRASPRGQGMRSS